MAQTIKLRRSSSSGAVPTTSQLALGEVAINTYDGKVYIKKDVSGTESIVEVGAAASPTPGGSDGQIQFNNTGTLSGASFLYADDSNSRLGIGTTSPSRILHVENDGLADLLLRDTSAYSAGTGPAVIFQGNDSGSTNTQFGAIYGVSNGSNSGELSFETRNSGSSAERVRIDSSGNVGIGTSSANERLTISSGNSGSCFVQIANTDSGEGDNQGLYVGLTGGDEGYVGTRHNADLVFETNDSERMRIDASGNVGIGNSGPSEKLHVSDGTIRLDGSTNGIRIFKDGSSSISSQLYLANAANNKAYNWQLNATGDALDFWTYGGSWASRITYTASGNVGIGTSSPADKLHLGGSANQQIRINSSKNPAYMGAYSDTFNIAVNRRTSDGSIINSDRSACFISLNGASGGSNIVFSTAAANNISPTEAMRINSAGDILINQTGTGDYTTIVGSSFRASGFSTHTASANAALLLNRLSTDGDIAIFRKDNTTVGSIGSNATGGTPVLDISTNSTSGIMRM